MGHSSSRRFSLTVILLLALLAVLSLTACGQTEDTGDTEWEYPAAFAGLETLVSRPRRRET